MGQTITLIGAEDVVRAGHQMAGAASDMNRAAGSIEDSLSRHRQFMDDWLNRLEAVLQENKTNGT